ncbi:methyl-accepting chemotaxis protein [Desulfobacterales bacterium HSG2]|nr:methyl-accepting chemotaxis protein [Desulfobacterales bacterium HSG2]
MTKLKLNLTIKRMLTGLIAIGVFGTVGLGAISLYSNSELMESQEWLTQIVLPLDTVTQKVRMAAVNITIRRFLIREAETAEELGQIADLEGLRRVFAEGIRELKELSVKAQVVDAAEELPEHIKSLETFYNEILDKDAAILDSVKKSIRLENSINRQIAVLEDTGAKLHKNAEAFSEKITGKEQTKPQTALGGTEDITKARKISHNLRLAIAFLTDYGHQMLLAAQADEINSIKADKAVQAAMRIKDSLTALKNLNFGEDAASSDLKAVLQNMETDFSRLRSALIGEDNSVAMLRSQWLSEQKNIRLRDSALKKIGDSLREIPEKIQTSSARVRLMAEEEATRISETVKGIMLTVMIAAAAFMVGTGTLIIRRIIIPINKAVSFADVIAQGDLTAEIQKDHNDEVGALVSKMSEMAHNLNTLIGQVQRSGIQVTSSATELSATSKQQETVMRTQLDSTNYVVKSVGEISDVSEDLVETMKKVATMSDQTADFASSGQSDLSQMEEAMHHMENASKSISGKLEAINEKAANITSVVTTITKVADQTNLLSLNAAIEAEKAGEYGRGFTVVAREIRRLADQTAVATLDIDQMVQEMQSAVSAGVMEMDAFITEVQRSAENVGKISMQLSRIIEQVQALSPSFEGVNESMQFQAEKAQQINNSMLNLSEEMQQTVDSLRESFMAIEQLNDAASGLQDEVSRFRVM